MENTEVWNAKGKRLPRIPEPVPITWKLTYSEEVRGHCRPTPTGCGPKAI